MTTHQLFAREKKLPLIDKNTVDEDVTAEENHAYEVHKSSLNAQALLALKLSKYYGRYLAVNQVSFCKSFRVLYNFKQIIFIYIHGPVALGD